MSLLCSPLVQKFQVTKCLSWKFSSGYILIEIPVVPLVFHMLQLSINSIYAVYVDCLEHLNWLVWLWAVWILLLIKWYYLLNDTKIFLLLLVHTFYRANAQQPKLFVGMILILIFAEALALYGLIVGIILSSRAGQSRAE